MVITKCTAAQKLLFDCSDKKKRTSEFVSEIYTVINDDFS